MSPLPASEDDEENDVDDDDDDGGEDDKEELSVFRDPPSGFIRMRPSQFQGLPSTIFIEYPPELGVHRIDTNVLEPIGKRKLIFKCYWERVCIKNAFLRAGFVKTENVNSVQWTAMFSKHQNAAQMKDLNCLQKINHFPASWCIGRKDRLLRTINSMRRIHGRYFDFHPEGFILPGEKDAFIRQVNYEKDSQAKTRNQASNTVIKSSQRPSSAVSFKTKDKITNKLLSLNERPPSIIAKSISNEEQPPSSASKCPSFLWITKPVASSCGKGISVITGQQAVLNISRKKKVIMQKYIDDPYLINGKKFDLRIYVLVSGVDPLRVYIHNEGLTRLSTSNYSLKNIGNKFAHLTNYSINKNAETFKVDDEGNEMDGFKWSLATFKKWLASKEGPDVMHRTMDRICDLCLKTMIAAESEITPNLHSSANYRTNCYELFGCDVMLDSQLNPHLLEVNVSPSLMGSSPLDKKIKGTLVADIFHTVGFYPYDPKLLDQFDTETTSTMSRLSSHYSQTDPAVSEKTTNPFAFNSLSKMMASQENWRKNPSPNTIDFSTIGSSDASWLLLLMAEDEFARARSTQFTRVHPQPISAAHYVGLYKNCRFADHLLAKWIIEGGSSGTLKKYLPTKFMKVASPPKCPPVKGGENDDDSSRSSKKNSGNSSRSSTSTSIISTSVEIVSLSIQRRRHQIQNSASEEYSQNQSPQNIPPLHPRPKRSLQENVFPNNVPSKITHADSQRVRAQSASPFRDLLRKRTETREVLHGKEVLLKTLEGQSIDKDSCESSENVSYDRLGYDYHRSINSSSGKLSLGDQSPASTSSNVRSSRHSLHLDQPNQDLDNPSHQNIRPGNSPTKRRSSVNITVQNEMHSDSTNSIQIKSQNTPETNNFKNSMKGIESPSSETWSDLFEISPNISPLRSTPHSDKVTDTLCNDLSNLEVNGHKKIHNTSRRPSTASIGSKGTMNDLLEETHQNALRGNTADRGGGRRNNVGSGGRTNQNYRKSLVDDGNIYKKIVSLRSSSTPPNRPRAGGPNNNNNIIQKNNGIYNNYNSNDNASVNVIDPNSSVYTKHTNMTHATPSPGMIMSNVPQHRLLPKHREFVMNSAMAANNTINGRKRGTSAARVRKI